ncbi:uncharacterized protein K02A2.6-like [Patiria miniata]|uniref:Reverse transcriptase n=1 Tax=Patiria miniata TaxID=46514 RepID=A0A914A998_PATMI|nr:uncharacterized protein K02A2.6-like [Patiria miniata]
MNDLPSVPNFDPHDVRGGSQGQHGQRQAWKKWLRSFELYVTGKGVTDVEQRKALLLHCAGVAVQDIFYSLPEKEGSDAYVKVKNTLTAYFETKVNVPYDRYVFRSLSQANDETVAEFVVRLRHQAATCDFTNVDEQIRDQVIEKCKSNKLRTKLLEKGHGLTLQQLQTIAATIEMTETQTRHMAEGTSSFGGRETGASVKPSSSMSRGRGSNSYPRRSTWSSASGSRGPSTSNRGRYPGSRGRGSSGASATVSQRGSAGKCYRCGHDGHYAKDKSCPARRKECNKCGMMGHFSSCCKTKMAPQGQNNKRGTVRNVDYEHEEHDGEYDLYSFSVNTVHVPTDETKVNVVVDKQVLDMIVDSGATVNIVDHETWEMLKANRIRCKSEKTTKRLYAYGSEYPLDLRGKFTTSVLLSGSDSAETIEAEFYVLNGKGPALLGRETALKLGVLKIGVDADVGGVSSVQSVHTKYPECFEGIGKLTNYQLHLHVDSDATPVAQNMYRIPYSLRAKVNDKLDELEALDIIEHVNEPSSWVSPVIVVPKPNGDIRLCVDMRQANQAIKRERHPIPTVDEVLYKMNGSVVFSKLDLKYGFHQIELDEQSRDITTFVTHKGLYRYKRLMFGINAAPEMYQNVISQVIGVGEGVANISDDIVVYGKTQEEHDQRLDCVMRKLKERNLTLNKDKCEFGVHKITFMGHTMSRNGIQLTDDREEALRNARRPTNSAKVRSFLGLVNFSARYIPNIATVAEPLRRLVRKKVKFHWGKEQEDSFKKLKEALTHTNTLGYFRLDADSTQLVTDASNVGLGAVLLQEYDGQLKVISYASRTLTDVEKRYSTTEKEALAVVWACSKFHTYLYGVDFVLMTDHKPLEILYGPKSRPNARIERWVMKLMSYSFKVKYLPGRYNIADVLSRLTKTTPAKEQETLQDETERYVRWVASEATPKALTTREVEEASRADDELSAVRRCLNEDSWGTDVKDFFPMKNELSCIGFLVLRGTRIVVPKSLRLQFVQLAHQGHLGVVGTKQRLRTKVWWPRMERDVENFVRRCRGCQITGAMPAPEPMNPTPLPTGPWQDISIDLLGPLPSQEYVLVIVDYYSRYYEVDFMKVTTSDRVIESLENVFVQHGLPLTLTSDNGPQFTSDKFEAYLSENGIKHRKVTPLHPAANGEVERQNRSLMKRIRIAHAEKKDWKKEVREYLFSYRTTPHNTTGVTPAEMMFKRKLRTRLPEVEEMARQDEEIRDTDALRKERNRRYIDKKRGAKERDLEEGDEVLVRQSKQDKLSTPFSPEPYKVVAKKGNSVVVESPTGAQYQRNSTHVQKYNKPLNNHSDTPDTESRDSQQSLEGKTENTHTQVETESRPVRERKLPKRFDDCVMYR